MGLKDVVVQRLQQYFGDYVDGLTPENLRVQVLAGTITQTDLSLKAEALAQLQLPVVVRAGRLRKFHVEVPWSRITSEPVVVHIVGVTVLAALADEGAGDGAAAAALASERLARLLQEKIEAVNAAEAVRKAGLQPAAEGEEDSYAARLGRTVLNNLRVHISDLHIRFEDAPPVGRPVCFGVQLAELRIVTTDPNGQELFVDEGEKDQEGKEQEERDGPPVRHKALTVTDLAVYLANPSEDESLLSGPHGRDAAQIGEAFKKLPAYEAHGREYLLQPSSGRLDVALGTAPWQPQATVRSQVKGITLALSSAQYEDATALLRRLAETTVRTESSRSLARPHFRGYRPAEGAAPRTWWLYLLKAHRDTTLYTSLYTETLRSEALSTVELTEIRMLELRLEVWQIMRCRAMAEATAGMEVRTEEEYLNSDAMHAPKLSTVDLPATYCSLDVQLTVTGMSVALSLTSDTGNNKKSGRSEPSESPTRRRKRRHAAQGLVRDDLVQLKLDSTYSLRVLPKDSVKEYKASIDTLTVTDRRFTTAGIYAKIFTPMAALRPPMDGESEYDTKLERFYDTVGRHPNAETVGMLAAATAHSEEEVAEWFAKKNSEHLATIGLIAKPSEYDMQVTVVSPFSVVYSPSLLSSLAAIFAAAAPVELVDEATAQLRKTREAMSAAIAVANVRWKLKASIAPFLFLLPQDVTDAASTVLAVDLGSFSLDASRDTAQAMMAEPIVNKHISETWSGLSPAGTSGLDVHAQIGLTDTQVFLSTSAVADWTEILKSRTVDSRRLVSPLSLILHIDARLDQARFIAAFDCTSGVEVSTTPEQVDGLLRLQQTLTSGEQVSTGSSVGIADTQSGPEQRPSSPNAAAKLAILAAATCRHVSWSLVAAKTREPVVEASMKHLVLCCAQQPMPGEERRASFRLNSISMQSDQYRLIESGSADAAGKDLVFVSFRSGFDRPAEMDVKLQQLTLMWHPEVIGRLQRLRAGVTQSSEEQEDSQETRGTETIRSKTLQLDLRVNAELTVLRFDMAFGNEVKYCATVSGAQASAEIGADASVTMRGEVQSLEVEDCGVINRWRRVVGVADGHDESLIGFTYSSDSSNSCLDVAVQSPMQFIYHPGLAQQFLDYLSVDLIAAAQQVTQRLLDSNEGDRPPKSTEHKISAKLCAPNVVYALSSSSSKSFSFDLCDLGIEHVRTNDAEPITSVRMVEPGAMVRGCLLSDFCGVMVETLSVQCSMQLFTVRSCAAEMLVNCLASTTLSVFNQRAGMWQVLCAVPTTGVKFEYESKTWRLSCEAAEKERISINVRDSFLSTLTQSFVNIGGTQCIIKNRSGVAILFAVGSEERKVEHGSQCVLLTEPVVDSNALLSIRPAFEDAHDVAAATLPLTETNAFVRDFTTSEGQTFSIMTVTELIDGAIHVTCRSLVELENTGAVTVDVYVSTRGNLNLVGTAVQDGRRVSIVKYNETVELRIALQGGVRTSSPFVVGGVSTTSQTVALPGENGRAPQFFQVDVLPTGSAFLVRVSSAFCVENLLPFDASFSVIDGSNESTLSRHELIRAPSGSRADLYSCSSYNCSSFLLQIVPADGSGYIGGTVMLKKQDPDSVDDTALRSGAQFVHADGSVLTIVVAWSSKRSVDIYTEYWLHNLTGLRLRTREDAESESIQPTVRNADGRWVVAGNEGEGVYGSVCGIELSRASKELFLSVESSERAVVSMEELAEFDLCLRQQMESGRGGRWDLPAPDRFWNVHCIVDMAPHPFQRTRVLTVRPSVAIRNCTGEVLLFSGRDDVEPLEVGSRKTESTVPMHQFSSVDYCIRVAAGDCEIGDPSVWSDSILLDNDGRMTIAKPDSSPWFEVTVVSGRTEAAKVLECRPLVPDALESAAELSPDAKAEADRTQGFVQISIPGIDLFFADFDRFGDADDWSLQDECLELHMTKTLLIGAFSTAEVAWTLSVDSLELLDVQRDLPLFRSQADLRQQGRMFLSSKLVLAREAALTHIRSLLVNLDGESQLVLDDVSVLAILALAKRLIGHFREEQVQSGAELMRLLRVPLSRPDETKTVFVQSLQLSKHSLSVEFARTSTLLPKWFGGLKKGFRADLRLVLRAAELYDVLGTVDSIQNRLLQTYNDSLRRQVLRQIFRLVSSNVSLGREALLVGKAVARIGGTTSKGLREMGFLTDAELTSTAAIVSKHFRRFHGCESVAEFERQLWHLIFDWDSNHTSVNARKCVCIGVLNKSASAIRVLDVKLASGHSCEVFRREVQPKSSDSWQIGSTTVLFASGESPLGLHKVVGSVGSIECTVQTTAGAFEFTHAGATFVPARGKTATFLQQDIHTWYSRHLIAVADVDETTQHEHEPTTARAVVWENQRRIAVFGLGGEWSSESLGVIPGDPPPFSEPSGQVSYSGTGDHRLLPRGGEWAAGSAWVAGRWQHSIGFQEVLGGWSETEGITDSVRRRRWTRTYCVSEDEPGGATAAAVAGGGSITRECTDEPGEASPPPRRTPAPKQVATLSTTMRSASRATLVFIDNRTPDPLQMVHVDVPQGTWADPPPEWIQPNEKVAFGLQSKGTWSGCEGRVKFLSGATQITLRWGNPFGPTLEGNWSREAVEGSTLTVKREGPTAGDYSRVTYTVVPTTGVPTTMTRVV
jgi:hypothetical protein